MKQKTKKFKVAVSWSVSGEIEVKAKSIEEAMNLAREVDLPTGGEYIDSSFEVNCEMTEELNK